MKKKQKKILIYDDLITVFVCVDIFASKVSRVSFFKEGMRVKHRGWAKPSPIKKELSAEFNDTSQKTLHHSVH